MPSLKSLFIQSNTQKYITILCSMALFGLAACGSSVPPPLASSPVTPAPATPFLTATFLPAPVLTATAPLVTPAGRAQATDDRAQSAPAVHLLPSATPAQTEPPSQQSATLPATDMPPTETVVPTMTQATAVVMPTLAIPTVFNGDPRRGAELFKTLPCGSCHVRVKQGRMIAPELVHIATDAQEIILRADYHGQARTAPAYIFESIVDPNAFVLPPYNLLTRDGTSLMPKDFADKLTPAQLQDLVAYLMTLR